MYMYSDMYMYCDFLEVSVNLYSLVHCLTTIHVSVNAQVEKEITVLVIHVQGAC